MCKKMYDQSTTSSQGDIYASKRKPTYHNKEIADEFDHIISNIPFHVVKLHPKSVRKVLTNFLHNTKERY